MPMLSRQVQADIRSLSASGLSPERIVHETGVNIYAVNLTLSAPELEELPTDNISGELASSITFLEKNC